MNKKQVESFIKEMSTFPYEYTELMIDDSRDRVRIYRGTFSDGATWKFELGKEGGIFNREYTAPAVKNLETF